MRGIHVLVLALLGAIAVATTWIVSRGATGLAESDAARGTSDPRDGARADALLVELRALRAAVERLEATLRGDATRTAAPGERAVAVEDADARAAAGGALAAIDALRQEVRAQGTETRDALARLSGLAFRSLDEVRREKTAPDVAALEALRDAYRADPDATNRSVRLLSPQEVIARFGPPDRVDRDGNSWNWYLPPGQAKSPQATFGVQFGGGYVTELWVSERR